MMRKLPFTPGARAWINNTPQYRTPLPDKLPVTIVAGLNDRDPQARHNVIVRTAAGQEHSLFHVSVDTGFEYHVHGKWLHEDHPSVRQMLEDELARLRLEKFPLGVERAMDEAIKAIEWRLERAEPHQAAA